MSLNERLEGLSKLPIFQFLGAIRDAFQERGRVVIAAPAGPKKSTVIHLLPARGRSGRVVVVEPRRIAREVGARGWSQLLPHPPEAEGLARRIRIQKGGEG